MKNKRLILIGTILIAMFPLTSLLPVTVSAAPAAQSNLVSNGGFESGTTGWAPWWAEIAKPSDPSSFNYAYKPSSWNTESISSGAATALIYAGNSSYRVINNWDPWYAGSKQVVIAPAGARVKLTAYGRAWASSAGWPDPSDTTASVRMLVGIEPSGSENQFAGTVVWSGSIAPHNTWQLVSVEATVGASGKVAIFLSGDYRGTSRKFLGTYWDEVSLVVVSGGTSSTSVPGATSGPAPTSPPPQLPAFVLPTAGADGNVVYIVQSGDSLYRIYANTGIAVNDIKAMNGLTSDIISVGQRLILVQGGASVPAPTTAATAAPTTANAGEPTATSGTEATSVVEPTAAATEVANTTTAVGVVCVMVYEDANGNTLREEATEGLLAGGNITLVDTATGAPVQVYTTVGVDEPHCFENLPVGTYTVSFAPPTSYNASGNSAPSLTLADGDLLNFEFGAQPSGSGSNTTTGGGGLSSNRLRTALFAAAGVIFLLLAAGVAGLLILRRPR
jgi:LysM repeat protein